MDAIGEGETGSVLVCCSCVCVQHIHLAAGRCGEWPFTLLFTLTKLWVVN